MHPTRNILQLALAALQQLVSAELGLRLWMPSNILFNVHGLHNQSTALAVNGQKSVPRLRDEAEHDTQCLPVFDPNIDSGGRSSNLKYVGDDAQFRPALSGHTRDRAVVSSGLHSRLAPSNSTHGRRSDVERVDICRDTRRGPSAI